MAKCDVSNTVLYNITMQKGVLWVSIIEGKIQNKTWDYTFQLNKTIYQGFYSYRSLTSFKSVSSATRPSLTILSKISYPPSISHPHFIDTCWTLYPIGTVPSYQAIGHYNNLTYIRIQRKSQCFLQIEINQINWSKDNPVIFITLT